VIRLLALAAALLPFCAAAQVHMCVGADGRKTFSDSPCGEGGKVIDVRPAAGGATAYTSTSMQVQHYEIRGTSAADLRREIDARGPEGFWGTASTRIRYRFTLRPAPEGCAVDKVEVTADSTVRLPQWANRHQGAVPVQDWWDRAYRSLDHHERGHVQISLDGARDLERSVRATPPRVSCEETQAEAEKRGEAALRQVNLLQKNYDRETNHGRDQWSPYR
jgi:predicted secreted Zn-dependent protease